jgi:hypothetical protein
MSPIPYIRAQTIALALLIACAALFDATTMALCCGLGGLAWLLLWHAKYRADVHATGAAVPDHRARLDRVVLTDALVGLLSAVLFAAAFVLGGVEPITGEVAVHGAALALAPTALAIWGSSLIDWYVILPRVSGQLGARPCRAAVEPADFPWPNTWKEVTRWWYVHRIAAAFAFRVGLSAALAVVIGDLSGLQEWARWFAAVVMLLLFSGYALSTLARGIRQIGHAKVIVGETVRVDRRPGKRKKWPPFTKLDPLRLDGRQYIVDVAIESAQLISAETHEAKSLPSPEKFARHADEVTLDNVDAIHLAPEKFAGCQGRCSGVNWYCIENPLCFNPK